ncbi:hypothetical protein R6Q57_014938 [Mikania cordata]
MDYLRMEQENVKEDGGELEAFDGSPAKETEVVKSRELEEPLEGQRPVARLNEGRIWLEPKGRDSFGRRKVTV